MDVRTVIAGLTGGKVLPKKSMYTDIWLSWYRGDVLGFHNYRIYNGDSHLELRRKTLQMAKQVSETWSNLLFNEKCNIVIPEKSKILFDDILYKNNFWAKANEGIEYSFALGLGAIYVNVKNLFVGEKSQIMKTDKSYVSIDFADAIKIVPITVENKTITECAFVSENTDSTSIVVHLKNEAGNYVIHNVLLKEDKIFDESEFDTKSDLAWFYIIRPNIANNLKTNLTDNELGISIFANSIDTLKAIDTKYDGFDLEYTLGRKRLFLSSEAWNFKSVTDSDGNVTKVRVFDPYDQLFYHLPDNADGKPLVTDKSGVLRHESYVAGLNSELGLLSMKCGLGESFYKFNGVALATATQVMSENSSLFRNIKKHEILLEQVLRGIVKTVIYASNTFTKNLIPEVANKDIKIQFDDSIIEDTETEMARDRLDVTAGIMDKHEYRMKWYGEDDKTAKQNISTYFLYDVLAKYSPALQQGLMTPEQFVDVCYPEAKNRDELIAYIAEYLEKSPELDMSPIYDGIESDEN